MTPAVTPTKEAHVISHTHWDREWYKPFQGFRFHLIKVIDETLDLMTSDPEYRYFHLDGQTVVLEDYAEVRPERVDELKRRIREGRILVGPWYDLADLFQVDGESLVRNFQMGLQLCKDWGAKPMPLNYSVDLFGHNSQMPQIAAGFGIKAATLFRGVNAQAAGSEFIWVGADQTECLVIRLCDHKAYSNFWYTFHPYLTQRRPYDEEGVRKGLDVIIAETTAQTVTPYLLFMDGVDHITANPLTTRIIRYANACKLGVNVIHSTWADYLDKVLAYLKGNRTELKRIHGELRIPNKDGNLNRLTPDVGSSRIYAKIQNRECEMALVRWFEPMRAIACQLGYIQPAGFLTLAWKYLLKNHPHDSICGCSIDQVDKDMGYRFDQCRIIAGEAVDDILHQIAERIDATGLGENDLGICVFNPSPFPRSGVVRLQIETRDPHPPETFSLFDAGGKEIPYQLLAKRKLTSRVFYHRITGAAHAMGATEYEFAAEVKDLPGVGYSLLRLQNKYAPSPVAANLICEEPGVLENDHLRAQFSQDGLLSVFHKETARWFHGLHNFEDCGEVGDLWVHKTPAADRVIRGIKKADLSLVRNGPLLATLRVEYTLSLPDRATADYTGRSDKMTDQKVTSDFTLTRSSKFLSVETVITNSVRDHRLRVLFPTDIHTLVNYGSSQFDVVKRSIQIMDTRDWKEQDSEIKPTQGFIDVNDTAIGLGVITFGLPEYAVIDDDRRTIAVTLLRALPFTVGTEGEDGPECLREIRMKYAIYPHGGGWEEAEFFRAFDENNLAPQAIVLRAHSGTLAPSSAFLEVSPAHLVFSSFRNPFGRDREAVLRVFNPTDQAIEGEIRLHLPFTRVHECNLNDEPLERLATEGGRVRVTVGPKKMQSLLFEFGER